ncbi:hypothetical protein EYF80_031554 [Liparis tanakae]|uniref:Uncharacterized protein n=1 Tax=Liparis tanakae TaxID=230148 RepID=A0A4Z2H034_9TELE|nr:hypothetical protein EYF80_031554 [Liparis tanakae]
MVGPSALWGLQHGGASSIVRPPAWWGLQHGEASSMVRPPARWGFQHREASSIEEEEQLPPGVKFFTSCRSRIWKVVHASLYVGAREDRTDPGAVHRHPHRHPGVRQVRVEVNGRNICAAVVVLWRSVPPGKRGVARGVDSQFLCAKPGFRLIQMRRSLRPSHSGRPPRVILCSVTMCAQLLLPRA